MKTWTKINQQNIFLEGHFKTIGKWVQKRQTLIFTVANFSVCQNEEVIFDFDGKTRRFFKQLLRPRAGPALWPLHALCVFSGRPLFDPDENPRSKLLLGKNAKTIGFIVIFLRAKTSIKPVFFENKGRKTNSCPRIRAMLLQYSSGDVMRNPYRQAV